MSISRRDFLRINFVLPLFIINRNTQNIGQLYINNTNYKELMGIITPPLCGDTFCLRNEVLEAYLTMKTAAEKEGISMWCSSGYRPFEHQRGIWNNKFKQIKKHNPKIKDVDIVEKIIRYSSIPGTSRHHWGTDLDIVDAYGYENYNPLTEENYKLGGEYQYLGYWLQKYASEYGFYQVYTDDPCRTGFAYEPWHYSYKPISTHFLQSLSEMDFATIPELKQCRGYEIFSNKNFMRKYTDTYMKGINEALK